MPDLPVRAIGYIRVSTAREEMVSPEIQRAVVGESAARAGRLVVGWITDLDASGRDFRRKVMEGVRRIEAGDADEVWVYRFSRWGRNAAGSLANIARVEKAGGKVVSATEPFDAETAIGKYTRTNALALAEMESDIIGDNWKAALSRRVRLGLPATGTPRFGYVRLGRVPSDAGPHLYRRDAADPAGERYVPDPVTGPLLAALYERFTSGTGTTRLLRTLNGQGVPTLRGGTWTIKTLVTTLDSGFAAGLLRVHDPRCGCGQRARCRNVAYLPGAHEPLISPQEWDAYRARRAAMRDLPPRSRAPAYPLTGLMRCGQCEGILVAAHASGQAGHAYRCNNWVQHRGCAGVWVRRSLAEGAVLARLREWDAGGIEAREATAARARSAAGAAEASRRLSAEAARAERELVRLVRAQAADKDMPAAVWEQARAQALAERERALAGLAAASRARERDAPDWRPAVRTLLASWALLAPARKRDLLSGLVSRVVVTRTGYRTPARIDVIGAWEEAL